MVQLSELHERDCRIAIGNILEEIFSSVKIEDSIKSLMRELNLFKIKWKLQTCKTWYEKLRTY